MSTEFALRDGVLPHPPYRLPILGDVIGVDPRSPIQDSTAMAARLGPMFERHILGKRFVFASGADVVDDLCDERRFEKFLPPGVERLRDIGVDGLFTAYNHEPNGNEPTICCGRRSPPEPCGATTTSWWTSRTISSNIGPSVREMRPRPTSPRT